TGAAYAWNTLGAIGGSLAGGFGLLTAVTALGAWRLVVGTAAGLTLAFLFLLWKRERRGLRQTAPLGLAALALGLLLATGPPAVWRHSPVGAGRAKIDGLSRNDLEYLARDRRRAVVWEAEGRESSVALLADDGYAFLVNGKSDGHSRGDAGTQVMSGMLGALIHPAPRQPCVISFGPLFTSPRAAERMTKPHPSDVVAAPAKPHMAN